MSLLVIFWIMADEACKTSCDRDRNGRGEEVKLDALSTKKSYVYSPILQCYVCSLFLKS